MRSVPKPFQRFETVSPVLRDRLGYHVYVLAATCAASAERVFAEHHLSYREFLTLAALGNGITLPQHVVADALCVSQNAVVIVADRLEKSHLLVRRRNPKNRREVFLTLTKDGSRVLKEAAKNLDRFQEGVFGQLTAEDAATFRRICCKLISLLER